LFKTLVYFSEINEMSNQTTGFARNLMLSVTLSGAALILSGCGGTAAKPDWDREFQAGTPNWFHSVNEITQDAYGELVVGGHASNMDVLGQGGQLWLTKFTQDGAQSWSVLTTLGGKTDIMLRGLTSDNLGNTYALTHTMKELSDDQYEEVDMVIAFDRFGQQSWQQTIGNGVAYEIKWRNGKVVTGGDAVRTFTPNGALQLSVNEGTNIWAVELDTAGNLYSSGMAHTAKHDAAGNLVWKIINPDGVSQAAALAVNSAGDLYVCHYYNDGYRVQKLNAAGQSQWTQYVARPQASAGLMDNLPMIQLDTQGNLVVVASNSGGRKLVKFNANGSSQWTINTDGGFVRAMSIDNSNNIYVFGRNTGEKFDSSGKSLGKIAITGDTTVTDGDALVAGSRIFVATARSGNSKAYLAKFTNP
jgi:hypothetical protein